MSYEPPTPPAELPTEIVNTLNGYSLDQLQYVARYAEELAEHKDREARLEEESEDDEIFTKLTDQLSFAGLWIENHLDGFIQKLR